MFKPSCLIAALIAVSAPGAAAQGDNACISYEITDLGVLDDAFGMRAVAINASDMVVGTSTFFPIRGFVWDAGVLTELEALPGGDEAYVTDLNDAGVVTGWSFEKPFFARAVTWAEDGGAWPATPLFPGIEDGAMAINNAGVIGGNHASDFCPDPETVGWLLPGPTLERLEPGGETRLAALNDNVGAVGNAEQTAGSCWTVSRPVLWLNGSIRDLGSLGGNSGGALDVNDALQVVGFSQVSSTPYQSHAFLWLPAPAYGLDEGLNDLGTCGGVTSRAEAINEHGLIVGQNRCDDGQDRAFVWADGEMHDLNELIPAGTGWELTIANDVNDAGHIVGEGRLNGLRRAFLLIPDGDDACACTADVDGSGVVDVDDLVQVIAAWGPATPGAPADVDNDGVVGVNDLVAVIVAWGDCPR